MIVKHIHVIKSGWNPVGYTTEGLATIDGIKRYNIFINNSWLYDDPNDADVKFMGEYESLELFNIERGWELIFKLPGEPLTLSDVVKL